MADEKKSKNEERGSGEFHLLRKTWLVWATGVGIFLLAIVVGINLRVPVDQLSEAQFFDAFQSNRIIQATINYDPQLERFAKISGKYKKVDNHGKELVAEFVTGTLRMTDKREIALLSSKVFSTKPPKTFMFRNFLRPNG